MNHDLLEKPSLEVNVHKRLVCVCMCVCTCVHEREKTIRGLMCLKATLHEVYVQNEILN